MNIDVILKATGLGFVVLFALSLVGFIPLLGCITLPLSFVAYLGIGYIAGQMTPSPREPLGVVLNGGIAVGAAAIINSIVANLLLMVLNATLGITMSGFGEEQFGGSDIAGLLLAYVILVGIGLAWSVLAALLGALGGFIQVNMNGAN